MIPNSSLLWSFVTQVCGVCSLCNWTPFSTSASTSYVLLDFCTHLRNSSQSDWGVSGHPSPSIVTWALVPEQMPKNQFWGWTRLRPNYKKWRQKCDNAEFIHSLSRLVAYLKNTEVNHFVVAGQVSWELLWNDCRSLTMSVQMKLISCCWAWHQVSFTKSFLSSSFQIKW